MNSNLFLNLILSFLIKTQEGVSLLKSLLFPGSGSSTGRPDYLDDPDLYEVEQQPADWVDPYSCIEEPVQIEVSIVGLLEPDNYF